MAHHLKYPIMNKFLFIESLSSIDWIKWAQCTPGKQYPASFELIVENDVQDRFKITSQPKPVTRNAVILLPDGWLPLDAVSFVTQKETETYFCMLDRNACSSAICEKLDMPNFVLSFGASAIEGTKTKISYESFRDEWDFNEKKLASFNLKNAKLALRNPTHCDYLSRLSFSHLIRTYPTLTSALAQIYSLQKKFQNKLIPLNEATSAALQFQNSLYEKKIIEEGLLIHSVVGFLAHRVHAKDQKHPNTPDDPFGRMLKVYTGAHAVEPNKSKHLYNGISDSHLTMSWMTIPGKPNHFHAFVTQDGDLIGSWAYFVDQTFPAYSQATADSILASLKTKTKPTRSPISQVSGPIFVFAYKIALILCDLKEFIKKFPPK